MVVERMVDKLVNAENADILRNLSYRGNQGDMVNAYLKERNKGISIFFQGLPVKRAA